MDKWTNIRVIGRSCASAYENVGFHATVKVKVIHVSIFNPIAFNITFLVLVVTVSISHRFQSQSTDSMTIVNKQTVNCIDVEHMLRE